MAAPPLAVAQFLAQLTPERREEIRGKVRTIGQLFAQQFGLTEEAEYVGWKLLLLLGWEMWELYLKAPVKTVWHMEQQLVGLFDQAYKFLGGSGSAATAGATALAEAGVLVASGLSPYWVIYQGASTDYRLLQSWGL